MTVRDVLDAALTEAQWQRQIVSLARQFGWTVWHPTIAVYSKGGWPDLVLLRPPRALFWEIKTERGKVSGDQQRMLDLLRACGLEVAVVRPSDWLWVHEQLLGNAAEVRRGVRCVEIELEPVE